MEKLNKATILVVDDKPANIMVLENLLATKDRIIVSATSGRDALTVTLNKDIDIVILDVQMPDMDGFEVAQILKSNKRTKDIPIIFASAERTEHKFMMKGYEEGAVDYLFKPLDPEIAKAKVAVLLKVQLQKKELIEKNISLQKSALLINNSADIIGIIDATTFKIEEINTAFTDILGYTKEEAMGTALSFFLDSEDRAFIQGLSKNTKERLSFETRIYCKDRRIKWLHWKIVFKDRKWFINARDITEVKEVEKIRDYLATVVKQSNDAIYIHDNEGKIISWNEGATKIYGYTENEALRMKIWNIIPEYMQPEIEKIVNSILKGKEIEALQTKRITKHGKIVDVLLSASVITDPGNDHKSIAITERDITEQKKADEQIRQLNTDLKDNNDQLEISNKELESFSYSISHDLKAPVRALIGYSNIMHEDYNEKLDDEGKACLVKIMENGLKMGVMIDDLLKFSQLGRKELETADINMEALVKKCLDEISGSTKHNTTIKIQPLLTAKGDLALLSHVWINLLSNAIKYSSKKESPQVDIGCEEKEGKIVYYVKDNGAGFDMAYANKLFGVFQRLHTKSQFDGIGIGLAIVQRIVLKHGGKVWAEGALEKGATFYFSLNL
jgi:PAS domain S-box-containing protein